eukprot:SAG31_NODE_8482_length_1442_cov_1.208333_2_plen_117_part_01
MRLIGDDTKIYLWNYQTRRCRGPYTKDGDAGLNLDAEAWSQSTDPVSEEPTSPFPAQIRVCAPHNEVVIDVSVPKGCQWKPKQGPLTAGQLQQLERSLPQMSSPCAGAQGTAETSFT